MFLSFASLQVQSIQWRLLETTRCLSVSGQERPPNRFVLYSSQTVSLLDVDEQSRHSPRAVTSHL